LRQALTSVIAKLPARLRDDSDVALLAQRARGGAVTIVHLINRRTNRSLESKDGEFSRATMRALWGAGLADMRRMIANPEWRCQWRKACRTAGGVRTFDLLP
jgi:hypothetical protein